MTETKRYYKGDPLGLTWAERRRICPNILVFFIYAIICLLRLRFGGQFALAYPCEILGVNEDELSAEAKVEIEKSDVSWGELGFHRDRLYTLDLLGREELIGMTYLNRDEPTIMGSSVYYRILIRNVETLRVIQSVSSASKSNLLYATLDSKRELDGPPEFLRHFMKGKAISELLTAHRDRLKKSSENFEVLTKDRVSQLLVQWNCRETEFHAERGFYVPADEKLLAKLRAEIDHKSCVRCGDFLGATKSIDHPGHCRACQPFRAEVEKKEHLALRAGVHTLLGLLAGVAGSLLFLWIVKSRVMLNTVHVIMALLVGLILFLVVIVLGRVLDKVFKMDKKKKIRR
ncbi:MAG: hypothetical protein P1V97_16685 [Planctomycetota bacterium]|nr:hypothetical protein [Planctomycetota bacterium]